MDLLYNPSSPEFTTAVIPALSRNPGGHEWKIIHHSAIRYGRRDSLNTGFSHRFWIPAIPPSPVGIDCRNDGGRVSGFRRGQTFMSDCAFSRFFVFTSERSGDGVNTQVRPYTSNPLNQNFFNEPLKGEVKSNALLLWGFSTGPCGCDCSARRETLPILRYVLRQSQGYSG